MSVKPDEFVDVEDGQVYEDERTGDFFEVIYVDSNIHVAQNSEGSHRLGPKSTLENNIEAGRYKLRPDEDGFSDEQEIAFEELDAIGERGAENLRKEGIKTRGDVGRLSDEELLSVPWVGEKGVESIRERMEDDF